jgi:protein phosphatase
MAATPETEPDEVILSGSKHLRVSQDSFKLRELMEMVESGVDWWEQRLQSAEGVAREQAVAAIRDLSRIFDSLSRQLEQGRETVRITTRLPVVRSYSRGCPVCGSGNRTGARFCHACGASLPDPNRDNRSGAAQPISLRVASRSDVGMVRTNNEDTCATSQFVYGHDSRAFLLLVADGMGGARAGEEASMLASNTVQHEVVKAVQKRSPTSAKEWRSVLHKAVVAANQRIYMQAQAHASQRGMGTTLTMLVADGENAHIAHVGDSRAYLFNANGVTADRTTFTQLSTDHTLIARLVDIGQITPEEARTQPQRNMLYRAIGTEPMVDVDTVTQPIAIGDVILLCSDGLTNHVHDHEMARIVLSDRCPEAMCDMLVDLANQRGGRDNISVVVAQAR